MHNCPDGKGSSVIFKSGAGCSMRFIEDEEQEDTWWEKLGLKIGRFLQKVKILPRD